MPEDEELRSKLKNKLREYAERISNLAERIGEENPYWHPDRVRWAYSTTQQLYSAEVLSELLERGELDTREFSLELALYYREFSPYNYSVACGVIQDYCTTGGKNTFGGTGF